MASSSDSSSRSVSRDKKRKRNRDRKNKESRSRSRSHDKKKDKSRKRSKDKVREKQKENKYRRKSRSSSRHKKRNKSRSKSSRSRNKRSHSKENSIELRSRSQSRNKRLEREEKLRKDRREKKYDNEVDKLKEKEIEKMKENEKKLQSQLNSEKNINNISSSLNNLNNRSGASSNVKKLDNLEKQMTEEEKQEMLRKQRLAKARVFVLVEREEEKKNEEMLIENSGLIQDDFLEEGKKNFNHKDKYRFEDERHFDENENEEDNLKNNLNNHQNIKKDAIELNNNLATSYTGEKNSLNDEKTLNESEQIQIDMEEAQKINVSLSHRNMPHLPNGFFSCYKTAEITKNGEITSKSHEFKKPKIDINFSLSPKKEKHSSIPVSEKIDEEEDPLDAYMKTIEKDATLQDYQIYQELLNQQFQKKYDEAVARDSRSEVSSFKRKVVTITESEEDNVKVIEDNTEMEIDESKVITLEDILKLNEQNAKEEENNKDAETTQIAIFHRGEEELDKKFIDILKKANVPDYDPLYGYSNSNQKKEIVLYSEDYNEYLKEDTFNGFAEEEAWLKLKKSTTEKKELKLVNHSLINYEAFRKDLYVESKEIANLKEEEVDKIRKENGDIKVRGKSIPNPIQNWYQCGLADRILKVLEKKGFTKPFPIQAQAIPCIMSGRDVIGIAETGSGKTLAFVLPMLRHVLDQRPLKVK